MKIDPHWDIFKDDKLNGSINRIFIDSSEGFKYGKLDGLFYGNFLGPEYGIVSGSSVGDLVRAWVGSYEGFKYGNLNGTLNGNYMVWEVTLYPVVK